MSNTEATAALLLNKAVEFMANKAGVTVAEIWATLEADPTGPTMKYLAGLLAIGVEAVA